MRMSKWTLNNLYYQSIENVKDYWLPFFCGINHLIEINTSISQLTLYKVLPIFHSILQVSINSELAFLIYLFIDFMSWTAGYFKFILGWTKLIHPFLQDLLWKYISYYVRNLSILMTYRCWSSSKYNSTFNSTSTDYIHKISLQGDTFMQVWTFSYAIGEGIRILPISFYFSYPYLINFFTTQIP